MDATTPHARLVAARAFQNTLNQLRGSTSITEVEFRDAWLNRIATEATVLASGWYDPPPYGIAVIADDADSPDRISFTSLRRPEFWPSDRVIDFTSDILYAYCSPVSTVDNFIGDFAITLYFGNRSRIYRHFRNCLVGVRAILQLLRECSNSRTLFNRSRDILSELRLVNEVVSVTDCTSCDLGHSLPRVHGHFATTVSAAQREEIRHGRRFINSIDAWSLDEEAWFTIEPQLCSSDDTTLPQISFHFVCSIQANRIIISRDIDDIYREAMSSLDIGSL